MQGDERGRAGRVDRQTRPTEIEYIRNAVGENTQRVSRHGIRIGTRGITESQIRIIRCRCTNIHSGGASRNFAGWNSSIFDRVPDKLQQHALLGIHLGGLAGRDAEERRLEEIDAIDQPGCPGVALARLATVWMIKKFLGPALRIDLGDGVLPGIEQPPESFQVLCPRKPAGCSDDRDRSVTHTAYLRSVGARSATSGSAT